MIKKEPYTYTEEITRYYYYTSDGKKFTTESNARRHEAEITPLRKIKSKEIYRLIDDMHSIAYYITSIEDINYLQTINYWDTWDSSNYSEPGWYICFVESGGDDSDVCKLVKAETYIKELEDSILEIKKLFV
jgi:hypothetical protein